MEDPTGRRWGGGNETMQRYTGQNHFDVIVIGGGISGAAVAYEAASRGLHVVLFEKDDFCSATSAASSKLIHGGLRYLANREFALVRESLNERRILANIAPNLVFPLAFMFPHYRSSLKTSKWFVKLGLTLYDFLASGRDLAWEASPKIPSHRTLPAHQALQRMPILNPNGLTGASVFYDCLSIAPERLALAFIRSAIRHRAEAANYARVDGFVYGADGKTITGVDVYDRIGGRRRTVTAAATINCAGPWADDVRNLAPRRKSARLLRRSEGIHIVTRALTPPDTAVSAMVPGGGHCFLIPWRGQTLIGTTDKPYNGHPDDYRVTRESIRELITAVNSTFNDPGLSLDDVRHCYGGLRPLVESGDHATYNASRRYEIRDHAEAGLKGLITVEGGKWTTSRHLAEKVVDHLAATTRLPVGRSISTRQHLHGCVIGDLPGHLAGLRDRHPDFDGTTTGTVGKLYGNDADIVLDLARQVPAGTLRIDADGEILAQAVYAVRHEMARTLTDIVLRRTGMATLGHPGEPALRQVAAAAAPELGWDEARIDEEVQAAGKALALPAA